MTSPVSGWQQLRRKYDDKPGKLLTEDILGRNRETNSSRSYYGENSLTVNQELSHNRFHHGEKRTPQVDPSLSLAGLMNQLRSANLEIDEEFDAGNEDYRHEISNWVKRVRESYAKPKQRELNIENLNCSNTRYTEERKIKSTNDIKRIMVKSSNDTKRIAIKADKPPNKEMKRIAIKNPSSKKLPFFDWDKNETKTRQNKEVLRKQSLGRIRLESKIQLRRLRATFEAFIQNAIERKRKVDWIELARFQETQNVKVIIKFFSYWKRRTTRILKLRSGFICRKVFECWLRRHRSEQSIMKLQSRSLSSRMFKTWKSNARDTTRSRIQMNTAIKYHKKRVARRYWFSWMSYTKLACYEKEQIASEEIRRLKINKYLERVNFTSEIHSTCNEFKKVAGDMELPQPIKTPVTRNPVPPTPMELRAMERQQKREALQMRYLQVEKEKEELEITRKVEEEKQRIIEKRRRIEFETRKKQLFDKQKKESEERRALVACHRNRATLLYFGLKPWKGIIKRAKANFTIASKHHESNVKKTFWSLWLSQIQSNKEIRKLKSKAMIRAATNLRRKFLLQRTWKAMKIHHLRICARFLAVRSNHKRSIMKSVCQKWYQSFLLEMNKLKKYSKFHHQYLMKQTISKWKIATQESKHIRKANHEKKKMWSKVRNWLDE